MSFIPGGFVGGTAMYLTSGQFSPSIHGSICVCCGRSIILSTNDRNLCASCDEDIPNHIPQEQYLTYMKELWRKK